MPVLKELDLFSREFWYNVGRFLGARVCRGAGKQDAQSGGNLEGSMAALHEAPRRAGNEPPTVYLLPRRR